MNRQYCLYHAELSVVRCRKRFGSDHLCRGCYSTGSSLYKKKTPASGRESRGLFTTHQN